MARRRRHAGDRPGRADPQAPGRDRRLHDAQRRRGGTQLPKTTAARLLRALERNGLAQRGAAGGFRPGPSRGVRPPRHQHGRPRRRWRGRSWSASARDRRDGEHRHPHPRRRRPPGRDPEPHPTARAPGSAAASRAHASSLGKVFMAYGAAQPPFGRLARLAPNTIMTIAEPCAGARGACARAATRRPGRSSRTGSARSPRPCAASRRRHRRHLGLGPHGADDPGRPRSAWRPLVGDGGRPRPTSATDPNDGGTTQ